MFLVIRRIIVNANLDKFYVIIGQIEVVNYVLQQDQDEWFTVDNSPYLGRELAISEHLLTALTLKFK